MSNNIGRVTVAGGQNNKYITINDSDGRIDAALTEFLLSDYTSADVTLTDDEFEQAMLFRSENLSVARALNVPQTKKLFFVDNVAGTAALTVTRGSGTVVVAAGDTATCYTDGTANGIQRGVSSLLQGVIEVIGVPVVASGVLTIDCNFNVHEHVLTENVTSVVFSNPPVTGRSFSGTLRLTQAAGGFTVAWGGVNHFSGASEPTMTAADGQRDYFAFTGSLAMADPVDWFTTGQDF